MNSTELTKLTGAVLVGGLVLLASSILAKSLVVSHSEGEVAMAVPEGAEGATEGGATAEAPAGDKLEPVSGLLAAADLAAGEAGFKKCTSCHSIEKGGANKVGPNLWGVVGGKHAHMADFPYSDAIKNLPGNWDFEALNAWLHSPKTYAPGTKMSFPGIKKVQDRANLIAWLNTQSDAPLPLPAAAPAAAETTTEESAAAATGTATTEAAPATTAAPPPAEGEQAAAAGGDLGALLQAADPAAGQKVAAKCKACHDFTKGGPNKVGPNLWGVVGGKHAHMADFNYSDAMKAMADKQWSFEELDRFLTGPKDYAPGTKMAFPGIKKPEDRANLIAWLNTQSDAPLPLPAAAPAAATGSTSETAPATTEPTPPAATTTPSTIEAAPATSEPTPSAATSGQTTTTGDQAAAASGEQTAAAGGGLADLLKAADPAAGQKVAAKCKACHDFTKDGPNKVGPNLWDIIGAKHAHKADYDYSAAIKGMADKEWTYEELDQFLTGPKDYAPGTKMTFAGLKKPEDRAALIAWLRTLSDSPKPLP